MTFDLVQVQESNLYPLKCEMVYGLQLTDCHIRRCWDTLLERSSYSQRCQAVQQFNRSHSD